MGRLGPQGAAGTVAGAISCASTAPISSSTRATSSRPMAFASPAVYAGSGPMATTSMRWVPSMPRTPARVWPSLAAAASTA